MTLYILWEHSHTLGKLLLWNTPGWRCCHQWHSARCSSHKAQLTKDHKQLWYCLWIVILTCSIGDPLSHTVVQWDPTQGLVQRPRLAYYCMLEFPPSMKKNPLLVWMPHGQLWRCINIYLCVCSQSCMPAFQSSSQGQRWWLHCHLPAWWRYHRLWTLIVTSKINIVDPRILHQKKIATYLWLHCKVQDNFCYYSHTLSSRRAHYHS